MGASFFLTYFFALSLIKLASSADTGDCSFRNKSDTCGYQFPQLQWKWLINDYNVDHTTDKLGGGYLNVNWTANKNVKTKTRVSTPIILPTGDFSKCLTFWFRLSGSGTKALRVFMDKELQLGEGELVWEMTGKTGTSWQFGRVPIISQATYKMTFEMEHIRAKVVKSDSSYASLDDIVFTSGPCSVMPYEAETKDSPVTYPPEQILPEIPSIDSPHNCTFEKKSMCNWTNSEGNKFNWTLKAGASENRLSGPRNDHTKGQYNNGVNGYYLYIVPKPNVNEMGQKVRFESQTIKPNDAKCLVFWYHMWGSYIDTLRVLIKIGNKTTMPLWVREKAQGKQWNRATINFKMEKDFKIVFEAVSHPRSVLTNIAIDDIAVLPIQCSSDENFCDFEDPSMCNYKPTTMDWTYSGGKLVSKLPPAINYDHTFNSEYGHYMAVTNTAEEQFTTTLRSSPKVVKGDKCLRFWYYTSRGTSSKFYVTTNSAPNNYIFSSDASAINFGNTWHAVQAPLYASDNDIQLDFTVQATKGEKFVVGLDDVEIRNGYCGFPGDCNFEFGDKCVWSNGYDDNFDWTLQNGRTETENVGPNYDHTLEHANGTYIFIEASKPQVRGDKARLYSHGFHNDTPAMCLHFWYNMNGQSMGRLTVYQKYADGTENGIWQLRGHQGSTWRYAKVAFSGGKGPFQLVFEATVAGEWGDIALDDIVMSENDCSMVPSGAVYVSPLTTPIPPTTTTAIPIYKLLDCEFQSDFCQWYMDVSSNYNWTIGDLSKLDDVTPYVPPRFSRNQDSNYMYIKSSFAQEIGQVAILQSQLLTTTAEDTSICFSFKYYMFGSHVGNLTIYLDIFDTTQVPPKTFTLWKKFKAQPDAWYSGSATLNLPDKTFKIRVKGSVGFDGVIAMDSFSLQMIQCQTDNLCDFSMNRTCSWTPDVTPLTWGVGVPLPDFGPSVDHTTLTEDGVFMYVQNDPTIIPQMGQFVSPLYPENFGTQCFTFWYNTKGPENGTIRVRMRTTRLDDDGNLYINDSLSLWERGLHFAGRWRRGQVSISSYESFRLVLEGDFNFSLSEQDYVAVDDLQMLPYPCDYPGSCSFDDGFCGYTYDMNERFNWLIGRGQTQLPELMIGPPIDASGRGMYAYADFTSSRSTYTMFLRSEEIAATSHVNAFCLQFWYLTYGNGKVELKILYHRLDANITDQELWSSNTNRGTSWNLVSVPFNSIDAFEIIFVTKRFDSNVFIGIDEVSITPSTSCKAQGINVTEPKTPDVIYACDFEGPETTCEHWSKQSSSFISEWIKTSGSNRFSGGPPEDHTRKTRRGQYILAKSDTWEDETYRIVSDVVQGTHKSCFRFWYFMSVDSADHLNIIVQSEDVKGNVVWKRSGMQGHVWKYAQADVTAVNYKVIIEAVLTKRAGKFIALDDVSILMSECPELETCTFDDGHLCFFSEDLNGQIHWQISTDKKPSYFPNDHTTGTRFGNYLYLNTTGKSKGQTAIITSPIYDPQELCIQFWFLMDKLDAILNLEVYNGFHESDIVAVWDFVIDKDWLHTSYTVSSDKRFQFRFMAMVEDLTSDHYISLDDVSVTPGRCEHTKYCDFEKDFCSWRYTPAYSSMEWQARSTLDDGQQLPGYPPVDHTVGLPSGYYITATNYNGAVMRATLTSSVISRDAKCLSFWYYANDPDIGKVEATYTSNTAFLRHIGTITIAQKEEWTLASFNLDLIPGDTLNYVIRLMFISAQKAAVLSIDDILIDNQPCDFSAADLYRCDGGNMSIPKSQLCDYKFQCQDKSDELNCGSCDFEQGDCNFTDTSKHLFRWQIGDQSTAAKFTQHILDTPDHTYGNASGKFMFASTVGNINTFDIAKAVINSPRIQFSSANCHLTYWQFNVPSESFTADRDVEVDIVYANSDDTFEIHNQAGEPGVWTKVNIYVGRIHRPFTIKFTTTESFGDEAILAIDDIQMISCGPPENNHANCSADEIRCIEGPSPCVSKSYECDFTDDCTNGKDEENCKSNNYTMFDFDDNSFGVWVYTLRGYGLWTIKRAKSGYEWYPRDHTTNSPEGYFLTTNKNGGEYSRIMSFPIKKTSNCRMRFYYLFYGDGQTKFRIFTWTEINGTQTEWFKRDRFWGDYYLREEIQFSVEKDFHIILEAQLGINSNIMLDDFSFDSNCIFDFEGILPEVEHYNCQENKPFLCDNATCLDETLICNFAFDCMDKSDENNCSAYCEFETDTCGWSDSSVGIYRWKRVKAMSYDQPTTSPDKDHTTQSITGHYMSVVKTKNSYTGIPSAYLETPTLGMTATTCVFSFAYHTSSFNDNFKLNVRNVKRNFEKTVLVLKGSDASKEWTQVNFTLGRLEPGYQLVFEAVVVDEHLKGNLSDVPDFVIDDAKFTHCSSEKENKFPSNWELNCTFDNGLCRWYQEHLEDTVDWTKGTGPSSQISGTGPRRDHTNKTTNGSYIFIESTPIFGSYQDEAWLRSPIMSPTSGSCLYFWYHMFGKNVGSIEVVITDANNTKADTVWLKSNSQGNAWRLGSVNIQQNQSYQIILGGIVRNNYNNSIAIDDISFVSSPCIHIATFCDFELHNCAWREGESSIGVPWMWGRAANVDFQINDHTTDTTWGRLLYFSTNLLQPRINISAKVINNDNHHTSAAGGCVEFWYFLATGETNSWLTIGVTKSNGQSITKSYSKLYSDEWQFGQIDIPPNTDYTLDFEYVSYQNARNKHIVLIDDITTRNIACQPDGGCDFESDFCGWEAYKPSDKKLAWLRSSAETPSQFSGPTVDKTLGTDQGFYLFLDSSYERAGTAAIISPELRSNNSVACFSFWYYMWGLEVGKLSVSVLLPTRRLTEVFSVEGDQGKDWHPVQLEILNLNPTFFLTVQGTLNGIQAGDIAIDEFNINLDKCPQEKIDDLVITTTTPDIITKCVITTMTPSTKTLPEIPTLTTKKFSSLSTPPLPPSTSTESTHETKRTPESTPNDLKTSPRGSSTKSTTSNAIAACGNSRLSCGENSICIRSSFWCDGIKDCPNNADEENCPTRRDCGGDRVNCASDPATCLDKGLLCNGISDCSDGSDESQCECSDDLCAHDANCSQPENLAICRCGNDYTGNRCQFAAQTSLPPAASKGWVAAVVVGILVLIAVVVFIFLKKFYIQKPVEETVRSIDNPAYDYNEMDNYHSFGLHESDTSIPDPIPLDEPDKGIVNPLYN